MPARKRTSNRQNLESWLSHPKQGLHGPYKYNLGRDTIEESTTERHGNLKVEHFTWEGGLANGRSSNGWFLDDYPATTRGAGTFGRSLNTPSLAELSNRLYANTNPSAPAIDVSQFIVELREAPSLLRDLPKLWKWSDWKSTKGTAQRLARMNLSYEFGWKPLLSDLASMIGAQEHVNRRLKKLQKMRDEGGVLHKVKLFSDHDRDSSYAGIYSEWGVGTYSYRYTCEKKQDIWGYAEWHPDIGFPTTDSDLEQAAFRAALGLNVRRLDLAWNLLPWSWLVDWGITVGDFLEATTNTYPSKVGVARICEHTSHVVTHPALHGSAGPTISPLTKGTELKRRYPAMGATVTARNPIISIRKLGILASLRALL